LLRTPQRPPPRPAPPPELPGPVARRDHHRLHRRRQGHPPQGQRPDQSRRHRQAPRPAHPARQGITPKPGYVHYTRRPTARDWLAHGLDGRAPKTITKNQDVLAPILTVIGARKRRELTAADVRRALAVMAAGYSTAAVSMGHLALKRYPAR